MQVNGAGCIRTRPNLQLVSVPNHNYQIKLKKVWRPVAYTADATPRDVTSVSLVGTILEEMGVTAGSAGFTIVIHGFRCYAVHANGAFNNLTVRVYDIESTGTGGTDGNVIALFEDISSIAGVAHISAEFPVTSRPVLTGDGTPPQILARIAVAAGASVVFDVDATVIRTPLVVPTP
jgi:hypothetical protein